MKHLFQIFAVSIVALLAGCGGGGSSPTPTPGSGTSTSPQPIASTSSFPLKSGYNDRVSKGHTESYDITGSCSGTATFSRSPASGSVMFGTTPAVTVSGTDTFNTTCSSTSGVARTAASGSTNSTAYYESDFDYLGTDVPTNTYYTRMELPLIRVPDTIKVGDTGPLGAEIIYWNADRQISSGKISGRYVVEPDTANTVIVNEIVKVYKYTSTNDELTSTRQERFRIDVNGNITPVSIDSQSNPPGEHLVYTFKP